MVEGRTLIMKGKSKVTLVENYRPIACLNFSWKRLTGIKDHLVIDQAAVFNLETRIAQRRFLTGLPRDYFF